MIKQVPSLARLWGPFKREYGPDTVDELFDVTSHGTAIMLRFSLGVWGNDNHYEFDLFKVVQTLDTDHLLIIKDWMADPFWP